MDLDSWIPMMRSPGGSQALRRRGEGLVDAAGTPYPVEHGIVRMLGAEAPVGDDARWNRFYEWFAPFYDANERLLGRAFSGVDVVDARRRIVEGLAIDPGCTLLEVCTGPGVYQPLLARAVAANGRLAALDLSFAMLRRCAQRTREQVPRPLLVQANGATLPFADATFDAVFHVGGIKLFSMPDRGVQECARVLRTGGRLFLGDEGFAPTIAARDWRRRILPRVNPGFLREPPAIPAGLALRKQEWVYGGLMFLWTLERVSTTSA
jgi:ubiquinone/menaquinone biosynthesis C-methylase UbiE